MKKKKLPSIPSLEKKLWVVFSRYIRLRDCLRTTGSPERGECITCDSLVEFGQAHAGHFIPRGVKTTKYHEQNNHLQCCACNTYRNGEQAKYFVALETLYGRSVVDELLELERKYKRGDYQKFTRADLQAMIVEYAEKFKDLTTNN